MSYYLVYTNNDVSFVVVMILCFYLQRALEESLQQNENALSEKETRVSELETTLAQLQEESEQVNALQNDCALEITARLEPSRLRGSATCSRRATAGEGKSSHRATQRTVLEGRSPQSE